MKHARKLQRQSTTISDLVASFQKEGEFTDQNDYGVCLLKDSPYRILRVSKHPYNFKRGALKYSLRITRNLFA